MPPLATPEDDIRFILQALSTVSPLQMNFTEVAKAVGMKQSGHASAKFQAMVKKFGYEYNRVEGKLSAADGTPVPTTPAKKTPAKGKKDSAKKPSAKKRKLDDDDGEDDGAENGAVKGEESSKNSDSEEKDVKEEAV